MKQNLERERSHFPETWNTVESHSNEIKTRNMKQFKIKTVNLKLETWNRIGGLMDNEEWDMKHVTSSLYSRLFSRSPAISCSVKVAEQTKTPLENWFGVQAPPILLVLVLALVY